MQTILSRIGFLAVFLLMAAPFRAQGQCSEFYGMTSDGGPYNTGTLFKTDDEGNLTFSYGFPVLYEGINPNGSLMQASNGKLYGMTTNGGLYNLGVLFEWDPATGIYIKKLDFNGTDNGSHPYGSLFQADNGLIYGMTYDGGANNMGIIFDWDPLTGNFIKILDFNKSNGAYPYGSFIKANNGNLYGMTWHGGNYDLGVLFELNTQTNSYTGKIDFKGTENGAYPKGSLIMADNGKLYGLASAGGISSAGVLFEYDIDSNTIIKQVEFNGIEKGATPKGSLIQASNGKLYGTTYEGGIYGHEGGHGSYYRYGVMFEWDPVTHVYAKKIDFNPGATGSNPSGSLLQAENGVLYGMAANGELFRWDPVTETARKLTIYKFSDYNSGSTGTLFKTANHKIYGLTVQGENSGNGSLFELDAVKDTCLKKFEFNSALNGAFPLGPLLDVNDGKLYGVTHAGGEKNKGVLFVWDISTKTIIKKSDFTGVENGADPSGSLVMGKNGMFYGLTHSGGIYNKGVIYEWNTVSNILTKKVDLNDSIGTWAEGSLVQSGNGKFYGTCQEGGAHEEGVLFEWDPVTNTYTKKIDFDNIQSGEWPKGSLLLENEKLYGVTAYGGSNGSGVLFEYDLLTDSYTKRFEFNRDFDGCATPLVKGSNGKLYGVTHFGGRDIVGVIYEFDPSANQCIKKLDLSDTPYSKRTESQFMQASNGKLYGVFTYNYSYPYGTIMEWDPATGVFTEKVIFTGLNGNRPGGGLTEVFNNSTSSSINQLACESYASPSGKYVYTSSGVYKDFMPNAAGCDSIITINLTLGHSSGSVTDTVAYKEFHSPGGKYTWTRSGIYSDTIPNAFGCDSIISINLRIITTSTVYSSACESYISPSSKYTWTTSGIYTDTIPSAAGNDSIITINLEVDHVDTSVIQDRSLLISKDEIADHQWIDCDNGNTAVPGETNLTFTAQRNGHYAVIVSNGACVDTSAVFEVLGTGINDPIGSHITLYPNPTPGHITIDLGKVYTEALITITRSDGQIVGKGNTKNSRMIEMEMDQPPGVYLVTVLAEGRETVFRVVRR